MAAPAWPARLFVLVLVLGLVAGCAENRWQHADDIASVSGLRYRLVTTPTYAIATWVRQTDPSRPVTVYIEGDGAAYDADGYPSIDPTPRKALGLVLASEDPSANVIYLARPCQFVRGTRCRPPDWTTQRFSEAAVSAVNAALDGLLSPGQKINLVGYSGGGAIAVLVAIRRTDVASLRTVAGNLDPQAVDRLHGATETLLAPDVPAKGRTLSRVPQLHFVGTGDRVVPASIAQRFVHAQGAASCAKIVQVDADHENGWKERWRSLLRIPLPCAGND